VLSYAAPVSPSTTIIVLSALAQEEVSVRASSLGAGHLTKPFDVKELDDHVRSALEAGTRS